MNHFGLVSLEPEPTDRTRGTHAVYSKLCRLGDDVGSQWCLVKGLRLMKQMTLMTVGRYNEPSGAYLPSILY